MPQSTQCNMCKNFLGLSKCKAFWPKDIPNIIFTGKFDHSKPYPGDKGIRKEKRLLTNKQIGLNQ